MQRLVLLQREDRAVASSQHYLPHFHSLRCPFLAARGPALASSAPLLQKKRQQILSQMLVPAGLPLLLQAAPQLQARTVAEEPEHPSMSVRAWIAGSKQDGVTSCKAA